MEVFNIGRVEKMNGEKRIQHTQYVRWWRWKKKEGAIHKATHLTTYQEESQRIRTEWLVKECLGTSDILEVGCSGGYLIEKVKGKYGLDIEEEIIEENKKRNPRIKWITHDARKRWGFKDKSVEIILIPDVLEHINFRESLFLIKEALRVGKKKVLITIPNGFEEKKNLRNWACFKHKWVLTRTKFRELISYMSDLGVETINVLKDKAFVYIKLEIKHSYGRDYSED